VVVRLLFALLLAVNAWAAPSDCPNGCNPGAGPPIVGTNGFLMPQPCACDWRSNGMDFNLQLLNSPKYSPASNVQNPIFTLGQNVGDGSHDAAPAFFASAVACNAAGGGTILVPPGRYLFATQLVVPEGFQNCTFQGSGRDTTVIDCALLNTLDCITDSSAQQPHFSTVRYTIRDLTIRGALTGASTPNALKFRGNAHDCVVQNVDLDLTTGQGILVNGASGTRIYGGHIYGHGDFEVATQQPRGIRVDNDSNDTGIDGTQFEYLYDSIYAAGPAKKLRITNIWDDHGFMTQTTRNTNSGGTVSYTATTLTDSSAPFTASGVPVFNFIRVLHVNQTGTFTVVSGNTVTDGAANFPATTLRGDLIRSGTSFAQVETRTSATVLTLTPWRDNVTKRTVAPPLVGASYTLFKMTLGEAANSSNSTTVITVFRWYDPSGVDLTPTNGDLYEVEWFRPGYAIKTFTKVDDVSISNNLIVNSSACGTELSGVNNTVENSVYRDGSDCCISTVTTAGPSISSITGNTCDHQNFGIALGNSNNSAWNTITGNTITDTHWANHGTPPASTPFGITILGAANNIIQNNTIKKGTLTAPSTVQYGVYIQGAGSANNNISNNMIDTANFSVAAIDLEDNTVTGTQLYYNNGATIRDNGSTGTLVIDPLLSIAVGSLPAWDFGSSVRVTGTTAANPCAAGALTSIGRRIGGPAWACN
jgi:hypothetical protein